MVGLAGGACDTGERGRDLGFVVVVVEVVVDMGTLAVEEMSLLNGDVVLREVVAVAVMG